MKKLKLNLDELNVDSFQSVADQPSLSGTVHANSCRFPGDPNYTEFWSTCDASYGGGVSCVECISGANSGCIGLRTVEESYCVCSDAYSCECAFSEASNCHRCTGP